MSICQVACYHCRIRAICHKRSIVQSAARNLHLVYVSIRSYIDLLGTGLSAVVRLMCEPVIEHVPLTIYALYTSVRGSGHIQLVLETSSLISHIAI